ncbi:MAG: hypothetical protein ACPL5F_13320 [Moorellaceae bacterium]
MDYNFAYAVMWFFSNPWIIKAIFFAMMCLSLLGIALVLLR